MIFLNIFELTCADLVEKCHFEGPSVCLLEEVFTEEQGDGMRSQAPLALVDIRAEPGTWARPMVG
jgi:hypothetical protein